MKAIIILCFTFFLLKNCFAQKPEVVVQMGHPRGVSNLCIYEKKNLMYSVSGKEIICWDLLSKKEIKRIILPLLDDSHDFIDMSFNEQEEKIILFSYNYGLKLNHVFFMDPNNGNITKSFDYSGSKIEKIYFINDNNLIIQFHNEVSHWDSNLTIRKSVFASYDPVIKNVYPIKKDVYSKCLTDINYNANILCICQTTQTKDSTYSEIEILDLNTNKVVNKFYYVLPSINHHNSIASINLFFEKKIIVINGEYEYLFIDYSSGEIINTIERKGSGRWILTDGIFSMKDSIFLGTDEDCGIIWCYMNYPNKPLCIKTIKDTNNYGAPICVIKYWQNGNCFIVGGEGIHIINSKSKQTVKYLSTQTFGLGLIRHSNKHNIIGSSELWESWNKECCFLSNYYIFNLYPTITMRNIKSSGYSEDMSVIDEKYIYDYSNNSGINILDFNTGVILKNSDTQNGFECRNEIKYSTDRKYIIKIIKLNNYFLLFDYINDNFIMDFWIKENDSSINDLSINIEDSVIAIITKSSHGIAISFKNNEFNKEIICIDSTKYFQKISLSPNGKFAMLKSNTDILIYEFKRREIVSIIKNFKEAKYLRTLPSWSDNSKEICYIDNEGDIVIYDILENHSETISDSIKSSEYVDFFYDDNYLISSDLNYSMFIWKKVNKMKLCTVFPINRGEFIAMTDKNYYMLSKNAYVGISFKIDMKSFPLEQFDLQYNRPDIVLERIGLADPELIKAYREAYYKRLEKMKFDTSWFKEDFYMPEIEIENKDELYYTETYSRSLKLDISAKDEKDNNLDRINVFVNGVPIYGTNGIDLRDKQIKTFKEKIEIPLNDSLNKIEVSVLNSAGVESLKDNVEVIYKGKDSPVKPTVYFLGIGVSNYQDANFNLNYAAKDIRDLNDAFEQQYQKNSTSEYKILDTLINERATRENILNLREKLMKTKVDDEVVIYLSGHGLLSKNNDFYYASYNMNFHEPEKYGLMYDDLDKLLDSIPARKKVLFIDACNSGEVEKSINNEELKFKNKIDSVKNDVENIKKGFEPESYKELQEKSKLGLSNSFQLMQEIFVNLSRGNGAVVISAARGYESAFESKSFGNGNGAFTACILEGLKEKKADLNNDKIITISELKEYVLKRVEELTGGMQKPTSRQENLVYDFRIW